MKNIKNYLQMNITTEKYGKMIVDFYPRSKNIGRSIKYFDNRMKRLRNTYKSFKYNKSLYFHYYFIKNKDIKINILQQEYYFSILLHDVVTTIKLKG
jgi:hypothetical protein